MSDEPTNKELRAEIKRLSDELGFEVTPAGSKAQLTEQLEELRAHLAARAAEAEATTALAGGAVRTAPAEPEPEAPTQSGDPAPQIDPPDVAPPGDSAPPGAPAAQAEPPPAPPAPPAARKVSPAPSELLDLELEQLEQENASVADRVRDLLEVAPAAYTHSPAPDDVIGVAEHAGATAGAQAFFRAAARVLAACGKTLIADALEARAALFASVGAGAAATHIVARGRSVSTKRGIVGPGEPIAAQDLADGEASLDALERRGIVVRS